jgi:hypothetical protein
MREIGVCVCPARQNQDYAIEGKYPGRFYLHILAFLVSTLVAAIAGGQAAPSPSGSIPQKSASPQAETGGVDEVSIDLVVHDKNNRKPYLDLKPEDLKVSDNGTPVTLKTLRLVSGSADTEHMVTIVSERFGGSLGRNEQAIMARILKELPSKGYSFAVMDLVPRLRLIQGFTDDRNAVKDAMKVITESPGEDKAPVIELTLSNAAYQKSVPEKDDPSSVVAKNAEKEMLTIVRTGADLKGTRLDSGMRARYRTLLDALNSSRNIQQDRHTLPRLAGLMALVRSQQKIAARKCIIYFTQNMQMDSAAKEMVKSIADAATKPA